MIFANETANQQAEFMSSASDVHNSMGSGLRSPGASTSQSSQLRQSLIQNPIDYDRGLHEERILNTIYPEMGKTGPSKFQILDAALFQSGKIERFLGCAHPVIFISEKEARDFRKFVHSLAYI